MNSAKTQGAERIAIRKRPNTGLLAGLWEFPNTEGALTQKQASAFAKSLGVRPVSVRKGSSHIHTFTHIKWKMRSYEIECEAPIENELPIDREAPECDRDETTESTTLLWVEPEALRRDHALPTAFRKLL
ncbi:MAG: NUDIX domain-containing protein [Clostridiales bacterium]|nr:NUDIX domain-containing protein [Clostridiales bacterium]